MTSLPPVAGLVLSGGYSKRMQADKAGLLVAGETQLSRAVRLLREVCNETFVSIRSDQATDALRGAYPQIVDSLVNAGPAAGILAAMATRPDHAWLIVAVDLPLLSTETLRQLFRERDTSRFATAFRSSTDGLPEPLCAIWEPAGFAAFADFVAGGRQCPRKFLLNHPTNLISLTEPNALANANTPEEFAAVASSVIGGEFS